MADLCQSIWACQDVQAPENLGSGFTTEVDTWAVACGGTGTTICGLAAAGVWELITWLRDRPSQVLLRTKSCSTFCVPIVTGNVWKTLPFRLAVIWY